MAQDGDVLLSKEERAVIEAEMQTLRDLTAKTDSHAITQAVDALNQATEAYAAKRMDVSVNRALAGQSLNEINL